MCSSLALPVEGTYAVHVALYVLSMVYGTDAYNDGRGCSIVKIKQTPASKNAQCTLSFHINAAKDTRIEKVD